MTDYQEILEECLARVANGTSTVDECLARYPEHATQLRPLLRTVLFLNLGPGKNPAPVSKTSSRLSFITQLLRSRPLQPRTMPMVWRVSLTFAMLVMALLVSGTARAQSALPGEPFYGWKRISEEVWRAVSTDPVATDLALSDRRLNEWIAVANDPTLRDLAMGDYFESLDRLKSVENSENIARILPVLQSHHDKLDQLNDDHYSADEVDNLVAEVQPSPVVEVPQVSSTTDTTDDPEPAPVPTDVPGPINPAPTEGEPSVVPPTEPAPTEPAPTEPAPTAITVPTDPAPTQPAPTAVSTEPAPTEVPTDAVPTNDILEATLPVPTLPIP